MKEKTKEILNKVINSSFFIILLAIFIILKTILFYKSTVCMNEKLDKITIKYSIIFICSIFGILYLLPKKARNITGIVCDTLISLILFADNIYYAIFKQCSFSITNNESAIWRRNYVDIANVIKITTSYLYFIDILAS